MTEAYKALEQEKAAQEAQYTDNLHQQVSNQ